MKRKFDTRSFLMRLASDSMDRHLFWRNLEDFIQTAQIDDVELLVSAFPALNKIFENDFASGRFYNWLRDHIKQNPDKGFEIKSSIESLNSAEFYEYYHTVLYGLNQAGHYFDDDIIKLTKASKEFLIVAGVRSSGIVIFKNQDTSIDIVFDNLKPTRLRSLLTGVSWAYYIQLLSSFLDKDLPVTYLQEILNLDSHFIHSALSRHINQEITKQSNDQLFDNVLEKLSQTPLEYNGIYNTLHFQLEKTYVSDPEIISTFLHYWVEYHLPAATGMDCLNYTLQELEKLNPSLVSHLLLKWLIASPNYRLAAQHVITLMSREKITKIFNIEDLMELSERQAEELVVRIIGFVFDQNTAFELILQVLDVHQDSKEVIDAAASLLYAELLLNYPSLLEKLKSKKTSSLRLQSIHQQIIEMTEGYYKRLEALPHLSEFEPLPSLVRYYNKKQFADVNLEESSKLSFLDMVDNTNLRAGKGFFYKYDGIFSEPQEMKSISVKAEMPRLELYDPLSQHVKRLQYRYATIDELYTS